MTKSENSFTPCERFALAGMNLFPSFLLVAALLRAPRFHTEYENIVKGGSEVLPPITSAVIFHYPLLSAITGVAAVSATMATVRMNRSTAIVITAAMVAMMSFATFLVQASLSAPLLPVRDVGFGLRR